MKTSESINKLSPALLKAQKAITFAGKNARNPHFKNTYANLSAVIDAVKDALNSAGIVFIQTLTPSDDGEVHLTTRLLHESGEWIEDTAVSPLPKSDPQGVGSAITYLRRYSLAAICGLYQDDDDGEAAKPILINPENERNIINLILKMESCENMVDLKKVWQETIVLCGNNAEWKKQVNHAAKLTAESLKGKL